MYDIKIQRFRVSMLDGGECVQGFDIPHMHFKRSSFSELAFELLFGPFKEFFFVLVIVRRDPQFDYFRVFFFRTISLERRLGARTVRFASGLCHTKSIPKRERGVDRAIWTSSLFA